MSDSPESSYYEIALTNRQVLTVFVVLLVCLVAAFFAGVWVGQEGALVPEEQLAASAPAAENGAANLAELNFFSEAPAGGVAAAPPPRSAAAAEPPPRPAAPAAPAAENAGPGPVIQVFSTADAGQAQRVVQRLTQGGFPVFLLEDDLQGQRMYRVRVGPYGREAEARQVAERLRRDYRLDTWITQQPG